MPINFTQIIKDSWNFIQNEKLILIKLIGLYVAASFLIVLLQSAPPAGTNRLNCTESKWVAKKYSR